VVRVVTLVLNVFEPTGTILNGRRKTSFPPAPVEVSARPAL
jgi:hypothetical protein